MADVELSGPLFDGRAERAAEVAADRMEKVIADRGTTMVHAELSRVLRHPTGYYESRVTREAGGDGQRVTDQGVIYGPWLEGTGSRNRSTRFKGYATFRRVTARLDGEAEQIGDVVMQQYIGRME